MFKGIKRFFNWLFNDVPPWPTDEEVAAAEAEAQAQAALRQEALNQEKISNGMSQALKGKAEAKPWTHTVQVDLNDIVEAAAEEPAKKKKKSSPKKKSAAKKASKSKAKKTK